MEGETPLEEPGETLLIVGEGPPSTSEQSLQSPDAPETLVGLIGTVGILKAEVATLAGQMVALVSEIRSLADGLTAAVAAEWELILAETVEETKEEERTGSDPGESHGGHVQRSESILSRILAG